MKKIYCIIPILLLFAACADNTKNAKVLVIKADVVMKKNDSIQVFYTTDGTINFNEPQSFWVKVKGAETNQTVELALPKDSVPSQLRIDFGRNPEQDDIILNKVALSFNKKTFEIEGKDIYSYFRLNDSYAALDVKTGQLKRKIKGQLNGPSLYPNADNLKHKLQELSSEK